MSQVIDNPPLLEVDRLCVDFDRGSALAVKGVNFAIRRGEILALVGESGSGKSTTAMAIARLLPDSASVTGSIRFEGRELLSMSEREMQRFRGGRIGVVFQDPFSYLNPVKTIGWQIAEVLRAHTSMSRPEVKRRAIDLLHLVGIKKAHERYDAYPHQFSGGMRQRAMIAMAIACRPALLIADEPTTALDVTVQDRILALLLELRDELGMGMLLITHNLGLVARAANRALVFHDGTLVESNDVEALFQAPQHPYTRKLLDAVPRIPTSLGSR